jgi:hypothetical protein
MRVHVKQLIVQQSIVGLEYTESPVPHGRTSSAVYSLQEVKDCAMAQPAWHAATSASYSGNGMEVHQLLPKANEVQVQVPS